MWTSKITDTQYTNDCGEEFCGYFVLPFFEAGPVDFHCEFTT